MNYICRCLAAVLAVACISIDGSAAASPTLLFVSGFEPSTRLVSVRDNVRRLVGRDESLKGMPADWTEDIDRAPRLGSFNLQLQGAHGGMEVQIIDDPTGNGRGKVMAFRASAPDNLRGRIQSNLARNPPDLEEVTSAVKLYLHPDLAVLSEDPARLNWFTLQELWTNPDWSKDGRNFRITLGIGKKEGIGNRLFWSVRADEAGRGGKVFWRDDTYGKGVLVSDVLGQWVTLVTYYKKGNSSTGRFRAKIVSAGGSTHEIVDLTNLTRHPTDPAQDAGLTYHQPHKLYTSASTLNWIRTNSKSGSAVIYWDDWEYWEGDAYSNFDRLSVFRVKR